MSGLRGSQLLRLPVRTNGIGLGRPVDLILDLPGTHVVGFDVLCGDDVHRFLPLAACVVRDSEVHVESALMLLDDVGLSFYRERGRPLRLLRGAPVTLAGATIGPLEDVVLDAHGAVCAYVVADTAEPVPASIEVAVGDARRRVPAA